MADRETYSGSKGTTLVKFETSEDGDHWNATEYDLSALLMNLTDEQFLYAELESERVDLRDLEAELVEAGYLNHYVPDGETGPDGRGVPWLYRQSDFYAALADPA